MAASPSLNSEKKYWWLTNRKIVEKYIKDAKNLIQTQETSNVNAALSFIDSALALSPKCEAALELKARSLLFLRRFREVADMLQDYIPSFKLTSDDDSSNSTGSNDPNSKLLRHNEEKDGESDRSFSCFYISDLKKKVMAGLNGNRNKEGHWRYLILGQACCHLGLMEDAMVLLQTARRLAAASFRRKSTQLSDDTFAFLPPPYPTPNPNRTPNYQNTPPQPDFETASQLLSHVKLLLRRRTAALSALDAGLPSESIRHFSKILESRSGTGGGIGTPSTFASMCYINRASAYRSADRPADAISDCNRALALDPTSIPALCARADLLQSIRAFPDCIRDLDHLKILYDSILRDRRLPGPAWKPRNPEVRYREIPSCLRTLTVRVQELRLQVRSEDGCDKLDYFKLFGVKRGCTRSEVERAYLLLCLKHKPDKATAFIDRLEFGDGYRDFETIRDQARMSAWILYRMLQKGYKVILSIVADEEALEKQRIAELATAKAKIVKESNANVSEKAAVYQGVFCRDLAVVGSMLSGVGFSAAIPVKFEGLSC